jgi:hypothetical protein
MARFRKIDKRRSNTAHAAAPNGHRNSRKKRAWEPTNLHLEIYAYLNSGKTQARAAKKFGYTQPNIGIIARKVDRWFFDQYIGRIREVKANHTQRLEYIYREALAAFKKSQSDEVTRQEIKKDFGQYPGTQKSVSRRVQVGNPALLSEARAALKEIREIWGANAPIQIEHMGEVRVAGKPIEEARSELFDKMRKLTEASRN